MIFELKKAKEIIQTIKDFNLTKYLLSRKEVKLGNEIDLKEGLIEHHEQQIINDEAHVVATQSEIAILKKDIKQLETDRKKIIKVYNLYID